MGLGCLFSFIFTAVALVGFAVIAPVIFHGQDMVMVGQRSGPIILLIFGPIGFIFGYLRHKRKK